MVVPRLPSDGATRIIDDTGATSENFLTEVFAKHGTFI